MQNTDVSSVLFVYGATGVLIVKIMMFIQNVSDADHFR